MGEVQTWGDLRMGVGPNPLGRAGVETLSRLTAWGGGAVAGGTGEVGLSTREQGEVCLKALGWRGGGEVLRAAGESVPWAVGLKDGEGSGVLYGYPRGWYGVGFYGPEKGDGLGSEVFWVSDCWSFVLWEGLRPRGCRTEKEGGRGRYLCTVGSMVKWDCAT